MFNQFNHYRIACLDSLSECMLPCPGSRHLDILSKQANYKPKSAYWKILALTDKSLKIKRENPPTGLVEHEVIEFEKAEFGVQVVVESSCFRALLIFTLHCATSSKSCCILRTD